MGTWVHRLTNLDPESRTATCAACGPVAVVQRSFGVWQCTLGRRQQKGDRAAQRQRERLRHYELDDAEFAALGTTCSICGASGRLVIDHCHTSGDVRGLLCTPCNLALAYFQDDPIRLRSAIKYLSRSAKQPRHRSVGAV